MCYKLANVLDKLGRRAPLEGSKSMEINELVVFVIAVILLYLAVKKRR